MNKAFKLTKEGLEKIRQELEDRRTKVRKEIADKIDYARRLGDLSENSAYKSALEDRTINETRIKELEDMLSRAEVFVKSSNNDIVSLGSKVTVELGPREVVYEVVGALEADPGEGKISNESPIGAALIDLKLGDSVDVELPMGTVQLKIKKIE